jgi:hypothetical protein
VNAVQFKALIQMVQTPGTSGYTYNPYLIGAYRMPALNISHNYFTSMSSLYAAWNGTYQALAAWPAETTPVNIDHCYNMIAQAAASFMTTASAGTLTGQASYNWLNSANTLQAQFGQNTSSCVALGQSIDQCDDPKWAIIPRLAAAPIGNGSVRSSRTLNSVRIIF